MTANNAAQAHPRVAEQSKAKHAHADQTQAKQARQTGQIRADTDQNR